MSRYSWGFRLYLLLFCTLHLAGITLFGLNMRGRYFPEPVMLSPNNLFDIFWSGPIVLLSLIMGVWLTWLMLDKRHRPVLVHLFWRRGLGIFLSSLLVGRLVAVLQLEPVVQQLGASTVWDIWENPVLFFDLSYGGVDPLRSFVGWRWPYDLASAPQMGLPLPIGVISSTVDWLAPSALFHFRSGPTFLAKIGLVHPLPPVGEFLSIRFFARLNLLLSGTSNPSFSI